MAPSPSVPMMIDPPCLGVPPLPAVVAAGVLPPDEPLAAVPLDPLPDVDAELDEDPDDLLLELELPQASSKNDIAPAETPSARPRRKT